MCQSLGGCNSQFKVGLNAPTVDSLFGLNPTTPSRPGTGSTLQIIIYGDAASRIY
jgi:hypothetical protein